VTISTQVAKDGETRKVHKTVVGIHMERDRLLHSSRNVKLILNLILRKVVTMWNGLNCLRVGSNEGQQWWWNPAENLNKYHLLKKILYHGVTHICSVTWQH